MGHTERFISEVFLKDAPVFKLAEAPALSVAVKMRLHVEDFFLIADQP